MDREIRNDNAFKFLNDKRVETLKIKQTDVVPSESFHFDPPLVAGIKIDGKMVMEHMVTMKKEGGVLKVVDVDGNTNPKNVYTIVRFYFEDTDAEVLGFGRYIMNKLSVYTRELSDLVSANVKPISS